MGRSRLELRRMAEAAEARDDSDAPAKKKKKAKAKTKAKSKAKSKEAARMKVRWAVLNDGMKQVAVFDYAQRADADEKAAALSKKGKGNHFVLPIKVPMTETDQ